MSEEEAQQMIDGHIDALMEHFDAVHVFVTCHEDGDTIGVSRGSGNFYARKGMIVEWNENQKAEQIAREIKTDL